MMEIVDRRLMVPKKTKISNLIETQYGLKDKNSKRDWLLPEEYPWALTCGQKKD
jgi:predicted transcriptional regulator